MKHTHLLFSTLLIGVFMTNPFSASAFETQAELQMKISSLREIHAELKAEVDAGTLSIEDARARWHQLLEEARAEKEAFFEKKRAEIEIRYETMLENNPERAEIFKEHIDAMKERHEARVEERAELKAKVEAGEISRQEANILRVDFIKNQQQNFQELKADLKERRIHFQEQNPNAREGYIKIDDIKGEAKDDARARLETGAVRPIRFDPTGVNVLEAFPDIKADINAAVRIHDDQTTPFLYNPKGQAIDREGRPLLYEGAQDPVKSPRDTASGRPSGKRMTNPQL